MPKCSGSPQAVAVLVPELAPIAFSEKPGETSPIELGSEWKAPLEGGGTAQGLHVGLVNNAAKALDLAPKFYAIPTADVWGPGTESPVLADRAKLEELGIPTNVPTLLIGPWSDTPARRGVAEGLTPVSADRVLMFVEAGREAAIEEVLRRAENGTLPVDEKLTVAVLRNTQFGPRAEAEMGGAIRLHEVDNRAESLVALQSGVAQGFVELASHIPVLEQLNAGAIAAAGPVLSAPNEGALWYSTRNFGATDTEFQQAMDRHLRDPETRRAIDDRAQAFNAQVGTALSVAVDQERGLLAP